MGAGLLSISSKIRVTDVADGVVYLNQSDSEVQRKGAPPEIIRVPLDKTPIHRQVISAVMGVRPSQTL